MFNNQPLTNQPQGTSPSPWERVGVRLLLALLVVSCSRNDREEISGHPVEAAFSARISIPVTTRASGTNWDKDDEIGIFMLTPGGSLSVPTDILADNYRYKVNSTGPVADAGKFLKPVSVDDDGKGAIYLNPGIYYNFVAYYPYKADALMTNYVYPIKLADQYDEFKGVDHDLLYSTSRRNNPSTENVRFEFTHELTNITINVVRGRGIDSTLFANKHAVITGMPTKATYDLKDKSLANYDSVANIVAAKIDTIGRKYEIIILPQAAAAYTGRSFRFAVGSNEYLWAIPDGFAYEQSKRYTYNFTLTTRGLELDGDVIIADWTDGGDLDPDGWGNGIKKVISTVNIPAGSFQMGSTLATNEQPAHTVNITKGFKMSKYEITVAEYCDFLNDNLSVFTSTPDSVNATLAGTDEHGQVYNYVNVKLAHSNDQSIRYVDSQWIPSPGRDDYPMNHVTWFGAFAFAKWVGGRLPTEAEWEYACRAGSTGSTATNNYGMGVTSATDSTPVQITTTNLGSYAWFVSNNTPATGEGFAAGTKPVGLKLPNAWGLYDIHGNVHEWCYDWYNTTYYTAATVTDPVNTTVASSRVGRGGYYGYPIIQCRSAFRNDGTPSSSNADVGFRVVFPL